MYQHTKPVSNSLLIFLGEGGRKSPLFSPFLKDLIMLSSLLPLTCVYVITIINTDRAPVKCLGTWNFTAIALLPSIIPVVTMYLHMHPFRNELTSRDHIFSVSFSSALNTWTNKTRWILKDELNLVSCRLSNYQEQDCLHGAMSSSCPGWIILCQFNYLGVSSVENRKI